MQRYLIAVPLLVLAACSSNDTVFGGGGTVDAPRNLTYIVEPSGTSGSPSGILLRWDNDPDPDLRVWNVYSRTGTSGAFGLRGSTTSNSFHDTGVPHLEYYATAEDLDGFESEPSNVVTVDERLALPAPTSLSSTSLDEAVALFWSDNAFASDPSAFSRYRVYSADFDLDTGLCGINWALEGTTVAPEFLAGVLTNGAPMCFGISAVSIEGWESLWSPIKDDTPRPDARNVVVWTSQADVSQSGFRFWRDLDLDGLAQLTELGRIGSGTASDIDFSVERDGTGRVFFQPVRAGTGVLTFGQVNDVTSIDIAPNTVYGTGQVEVLPGHGYVFEMDGGDGFARFGAIRATHVGQDFVLLDWAFQTDPGNPELLVAGRR